jgi:hypothetical protein
LKDTDCQHCDVGIRYRCECAEYIQKYREWISDPDCKTCKGTGLSECTNRNCKGK